MFYFINIDRNCTVASMLCIWNATYDSFINTMFVYTVP